MPWEKLNHFVSTFGINANVVYIRNRRKHKHNPSIMKGTEKQIKYANDLISDAEKNVQKFLDKGKKDHPKVQEKLQKIEMAKTLETAHLVIELFTKWTGDLHGERGFKAYFKIK